MFTIISSVIELIIRLLLFLIAIGSFIGLFWDGLPSTTELFRIIVTLSSALIVSLSPLSSINSRRILIIYWVINVSGIFAVLLLGFQYLIPEYGCWLWSAAWPAFLASSFYFFMATKALIKNKATLKSEA
jgi:hypothetical protein